MTKAELISDIILRITKGKPSDDLELEPRQIAYWANLILPGLVAKTVNEQVRSNAQVDPAYIIEENCLPLEEVVTSCDSECKGFPFKVVLTYQPMYVIGDKGMLFVETSEGEIVHKISTDQLFLIKHLQFAKPQLGNLVYNRVKQTLYIGGLDLEADEELSVNVKYIPRQDINALADTDQIYIGDDILDLLSDLVEEKARRQMLNSPEDLENNGKQNLDNA
jgi:hypothetical protein